MGDSTTFSRGRGINGPGTNGPGTNGSVTNGPGTYGPGTNGPNFGLGKMLPTLLLLCMTACMREGRS